MRLPAGDVGWEAIKARLRRGSVQGPVFGAALSAGALQQLLAPEAFVRDIAAVNGFCAFLAYCRWFSHVARGHFRKGACGHVEKGASKDPQCWVNRLIVVRWILVSVWFGEAAWMLEKPVGWVQGVISAPLLIAVWGVEGTAARLAEQAGHRPTSWALRRSRTARRVRAAFGRVDPRVDKAVDRVLKLRPLGHLSAFAFITSLALLLAVVANVPAMVRAGHEVIQRERPTRRPAAPTQPAPDKTKPAPPETVARPARSPTPRPPKSTYADQCGTTIQPGDPAPEPQRSALRALWLGGRGRDGEGATQAGCAQLATEVPGRPAFYYAVGMCGSEIRSLGLADPDRRAAILFQQAGRFAKSAAEAGTLVAATNRISVGVGDAYVVTTTQGPFVLIRPQKALGIVAPSTSGPRCARIRTENVRYSVVPPGLLKHWLGLIRKFGWVWPRENTRNASAAQFAFTLDGGGKNVVARASCADDTRCVLHSRPVQIVPGSVAEIVGEILRRARTL